MATDPDRSGSRPVASVTRALRLLDELGASPGGLGVNELARRIGVNASTASRLLATLEAGGVVERASDAGPYRLGLRLVALADGVLARLDVRDLARPRLRALVDATGETATLSVPGAAEAVTVDFVAAESSVMSVARLGRPSVGHATAAGKVVLAFGAAAAPAELTRFTDRTIADARALAAEIERVRTRGWAEAAGEREPDLNALAVPVFGRSGELAAVLGLQGPAARLTEARRAEVLPAVLDAAAELQRALGG